jgi:SAM-dependent methyltransferase
MTSLEQHQIEIEQNRRSWQNKPLLQRIYADFYDRILQRIEPSLPGAVVELGSGIGNLKAHLPRTITTDLFPNPWLDLACDAYRLPFAPRTVSHLILFDVFHHLERPRAFFDDARRVLTPGGRVILFEPFISATSYPVYGLLHHEPVAFGKEISAEERPPSAHAYYAAQGNATRIFFRREFLELLPGWIIAHAEAFSAFAYLFSGGYSKPALYPTACLPLLQRIDVALSRAARLFGGRCLVELRARDGDPSCPRPLVARQAAQVD